MDNRRRKVSSAMKPYVAYVLERDNIRISNQGNVWILAFSDGYY